MAHVAFVDDDKLHIAYYVQSAMGAGHTTDFFSSPKSCLTALRGGGQFDVFVVDLMMPARGEYKTEDTDNGKYTGVLLARDIRELFPETPICIFTNMNVQPVLDEVERRVRDLVNVFVSSKAEFPPKEFGNLVSALLSDDMPKKDKGILAWFLKSLIFEPNFYGIGLKLKS